MTSAEYDRLSERLGTRLESDPRVLALVALGSTARPERRDAYSDHDFWVVVTPGAKSIFLDDTSWLPDTHELAASSRSGAHYLVVLYASGHTMEFGIFEPDELTQGKLEAYDIMFDRHGIADQLAEIAKQSRGRPPTPNDRSECEMLFVMLLTGAARAARGEHLKRPQVPGVLRPGHSARPSGAAQAVD